MSQINNDSHSTQLLTAADEGQTIALGKTQVRILVHGEATDGAFSLVEYILPPGPPPAPAHRHSFDEVFHVLEGSLRFQIGDRTVRAGPGDTVHVPGSVTHDLQTGSEAPARFLMFAAPAGIEQFFQRIGEFLAAQPAGPPDMAAVRAHIATLWPHYGIEPMVDA